MGRASSGTVTLNASVRSAVSFIMGVPTSAASIFHPSGAFSADPVIFTSEGWARRRAHPPRTSAAIQRLSGRTASTTVPEASLRAWTDSRSFIPSMKSASERASADASESPAAQSVQRGLQSGRLPARAPIFRLQGIEIGHRRGNGSIQGGQLLFQRAFRKPRQAGRPGMSCRCRRIHRAPAPTSSPLPRPG